MPQASRILIVEDDFLIAMELELILREVGYEVLGPLARVSAALELLRAQSPDAAVLDVDLGGEWVTPVAHVLRSMNVPFVLASGFNAEDLAAEPILSEAVKLGKPVRPERLRGKLHSLLTPAAP